MSGELIPSSPRQVSFAPEVEHLPAGHWGIPLLARARYASERKQFEGYTRLVNAKTQLVRALADQRAAVQEFAWQSERANNLGTIQETAKQSVLNEWAAIHRQGEMAELAADAERERLLLVRDQYRLQREALNAPPAPSPPPKEEETMAQAFARIFKDITEIERVFEESRLEEIRRAGGEQHLSEDQRRRLDQFVLLRDHLVNDIMAGLV